MLSCLLLLPFLAPPGDADWPGGPLPGTSGVAVTLRVVDAEGRPLEGALVRLGEVEDGFGPRPVLRYHATTDARGRARIEDFEASAHHAVGFVSAPGKERAALDLEAAPGSELDLGTVVLAASSARAEGSESVRPFEGRVLLPDGDPAAGVLVLAAGWGDGSDGVTDADGRFRVEAPPSTSLALLTTGGEIAVPLASHPGAAGAEAPTRSTDGRLEIRLAGAACGLPAAHGAEGIRWDAWVGGRWTPVAEAWAGTCFDGARGKLVRRARAPGHVPRVVELGPDSTRPVDFSNDLPRALRVASPRGSVPDARVEVFELLEGPGEAGFLEPEAVRVLSARTDEAGRLRLSADPARTYQVRVQAAGHDAVVASWPAGEETWVVLPARTVSARFEGLAPGERVRIARSGEVLARHVVAAEEDVLELALAPGAYDALVLSPAGESLRGTSFVLAGTGEQHVDLRLDRRARVTLHLPAAPAIPPDRLRFLAPEARPAVDRWHVGLQRGSPGEALEAGEEELWGAYPTADELAREPAESGVREFPLDGTGRFWLTVGLEVGMLDTAFLRELEVRPGAALEVTLPEPTASLEGTMRVGTWNPFHGIAGPRLWLAPREASGWHAVVWTPAAIARDADAIRVEGLLPGSYLVQAHLIGRGVAGATDDDGAGYAWGAPALELRAGETSALPDLAGTPVGPLTVEIRDARGELLKDAALRVLDPCYEAWSVLARRPSDMGLADAPLHPPPAVRLQGLPVELPSIRAGRLDLEVVLDAGGRLRLGADVDPARPLRLVVR